MTTKSVEPHGIDFQPIPKRFMVWHKSGKGWLKGRSGGYVVDLVDISKGIKSIPHLLDRCTIVQSTNLFDKNGQEIFEGSLIKDDVGDIGVIRFEDGALIIDWNNDEFVNYRFGKVDAEIAECVGHILSNPELVEEK